MPASLEPIPDGSWTLRAGRNHDPSRGEFDWEWLTIAARVSETVVELRGVSRPPTFLERQEAVRVLVEAGIKRVVFRRVKHGRIGRQRELAMDHAKHYSSVSDAVKGEGHEKGLGGGVLSSFTRFKKGVEAMLENYAALKTAEERKAAREDFWNNGLEKFIAGVMHPDASDGKL